MPAVTNETSTLLLIAVQFVTAMLQVVLTPLIQQWLEQRRAYKAEPTPETAPEPSLLPREGRFMRAVRSPWVFPRGVVVLVLSPWLFDVLN